MAKNYIRKRKIVQSDELYAMATEHCPEPIPFTIKQPLNLYSLTNLTAFFKWLSTAIMLSAALAIVNDWKPYTIWLLNLGSLSWLITSVLWKEWSLIIVNASLLAVYAYGLVFVQ